MKRFLIAATIGFGCLLAGANLASAADAQANTQQAPTHRVHHARRGGSNGMMQQMIGMMQQSGMGSQLSGFMGGAGGGFGGSNGFPSSFGGGDLPF